MPAHDWTQVDAGIFHAFHHDWITDLARTLNRGILPEDYYALPEQHAAGFGPDVLTLQGAQAEERDSESPAPSLGGAGLLVAAPKLVPIDETDMEFYRRKQNLIAVRHVSGDRVVAMIEIVSPGNKAARNALRSFIEKAAELLDQRIHLLIVDLLPPSGKTLAAASYETALTVRAYVCPFAVGDPLPEMPLFLEPNGCVQVPLEATYQAAFSAMPRRVRRLLERAE